MCIGNVYEKFGIDMVLQTIMSEYPGSKIFGHFDPDPNEFRVHIEYLGKMDNIKFNVSASEYRDFVIEVTSAVIASLDKMKNGEENRAENTTDSMLKRLFDICKTYDVSVTIRPTTVSDDICCVRVLKDKQAIDYLIDLDEIAQSVMPIDEAFITRIDMAAKELSNNVRCLDLESVDGLTIK